MSCFLLATRGLQKQAVNILLTCHHFSYPTNITLAFIWSSVSEHLTKSNIHSSFSFVFGLYWQKNIFLFSYWMFHCSPVHLRAWQCTEGLWVFFDWTKTPAAVRNKVGGSIESDPPWSSGKINQKNVKPLEGFLEIKGNAASGDNYLRVLWPIPFTFDWLAALLNAGWNRSHS